MQTRQLSTSQTPCHTVINNPVFNVNTLANPARASTVPRGQTPIKIEAARQYTRLTPEERETLRRTGGCFRCCQTGHMASQCPRTAQVTAVSAPATPATPAYVPPAPMSAPVFLAATATLPDPPVPALGF